MPEYRIIAVGGKEFIIPFSLAGLETAEADKIGNSDIFNEKEFDSTVYIVDENIIEDIKVLQELENRGANITVLKPWGKSEMADNKIKKASIKAMGVDMLKEPDGAEQ